MVKAGLELIQKNQLADRVDICKASLLDEFHLHSALQIPSSGFDAIYTERSIINLDTFDQQRQAVFMNILHMVGGLFCVRLL